VGMKIMQERAQRIGASVQVRSELGKGTRMQLSLPSNPVSGANAGGLTLLADELAAMRMVDG